jgi:xanthine dehydrogenase accessory factor
MSVRQLIQTFETWRGRGAPMVLATVYDTIGSTYSKAGHRILIDANGDYQGLVSGGCLEGDLAERARGVLDSGKAQAVTYDLRDEADNLWGLGVGCNGLIRVFLQALTAPEDYQPFTSIAGRLLATRPSVVATVVASHTAATPPGATLIWSPAGSERWKLDESTGNRLAQGCRSTLATDRTRYESDGPDLEVLYALLKPVPRLLVLGAGLDAVPLVDMAVDLGWLVTVADHRPAYLEKGGFERAERAVVVDPRALSVELALEDFDAIVVMSHHLDTDRTYLRQLASVDTTRYLGVLGPPARRNRLLEELGESGIELRSKLKGPVGLDIGADSPESIALSLLAELHATLAGATGATLTAG